MLRRMAGADEVWIPLVDEPIGSIVGKIQDEHADILELVGTPRRLLAFRTFAYIRVGLLLGELLVEHDLEPYDGTDTWIESLLRDPANHERVVSEVRAVAEEVAADATYEDDPQLGPDDDARARFREFARKRLDAL
jgi:hypothetical protein